jgi:hypothetical protein
MRDGMPSTKTLLSGACAIEKKRFAKKKMWKCLCVVVVFYTCSLWLTFAFEVHAGISVPFCFPGTFS